MQTSTDNQIVIDHGSYYTKYGYAGYNKPQNKIRSRMYCHKITKQIFTHSQVVKNNIQYKDLTTINIIKNAIIVDFVNIINLWNEIFEDLKITDKTASLSNILITQPLFIPNNYHENIIKTIELLYKFKKIEFCNQQLLGLYGSCSDKGIVIDIGHDGTRIVPIFDSYILTEGVVFFSVCRNLYNKYLINNKSLTTVTTFQNMLLNPNDYNVQDFNLVEVLIRSIKSVPIDLRKKLCQNIIIIGGGSMGMGINLCNTLKLELEKIFVGMIINISYPMNRCVISWLGGSMFCSLSSANNLILQSKN